MSPPNYGVTGRRRDSRLRMRGGIPAQLMTLRGQMGASLCDLSQTGAHLRFSGDLRKEEDVVLWWLGFEAFGRIVWLGHGECGLEFDEPLPAAQLIQTRDQVDLGEALSTDRSHYEDARKWYMGLR